MPAVNQRILKRAEEAIRDRVFPGCVIGVLRNDTKEIFPLGHFTYENNSSIVTNETVYDLASITKSIPTASLALFFAEEGKLRLSDLVKDHLPEFQNDHGATIKDLLLYRVRGPRMSTLPFATFEQIRTHIFETGFDGAAGNSEYTNLPAYVLGAIIERVGGGSLAALAHHYLFKPLEIGKTTFFPYASDCAPTEVEDGMVIQGVVHDESARLFQKARRTAGHAGLFSTAEDLLTFLESLFQGRFPAVLSGAENGLGWTLNQEWFMGSRCGAKTFGKTGFTGTSIVADKDKRTALAILSNRTYPTRPKDATSTTSAINTFRKDIADIVFG